MVAEHLFRRKQVALFQEVKVSLDVPTLSPRMPRMMMNRDLGRVPVGNQAVTYLEFGFPEATVKGLEGRGHSLAPPGNAGGVQGVAIDAESGALMGGSDPRRDGHAIAW